MSGALREATSFGSCGSRSLSSFHSMVSGIGMSAIGMSGIGVSGIGVF